jgi:hypothetical protein
MTKDQFIAQVEAKTIFIKWAQVPAVFETVGGVEKWRGVALITTPDGTNLYDVWFIVSDGVATWQNLDTMEPEKNSTQTKLDALSDYLKANFNGFFVLRSDLVNNWAEAEVFSVSGADLTRSTVLVFKVGNNPVTHRKII